MLNLVFIFGTRPEAIKIAPVIKELQKEKNINLKIIVTAQHREMLDQVLNIFEIKPDYDLNIMTEGQSLFQVSSKVLNRLEKILKKENPNIVLVHGDTTTTLASALASYYLKIPVGHIEAGLRTFDKYRPFPEEINRHLTDIISDLHFAPTWLAKKNLIFSGIKQETIFVTGNTVIDALLEISKKKYSFPKSFQNILRKKYILVTCHRRESFGIPLQEICLAIKEIAENYKDLEIIFSLHKNPVVKNYVTKILRREKNIHLIEPQDYLFFVNLMKKSYLILTDSGGIQEEAPTFGIPVLVLREKTERPEAVKAGCVRLVGVSKERIIQETLKVLEDEKEYNKMSKLINPYGDGKASKRIREGILYYFKIRKNKPGEFYAKVHF